jgi:hypothetical protein
MGSPKSLTTEEPGPRREGATFRSKGTPKAGIDGVEVAYSGEEPPSGVFGPARCLRAGCCREC